MKSSFEYFEMLGATVERMWADRRNDEHVFPEVAVAALEACEPPASLDPVSVLHDTVTAPALPQQVDPRAAFGQPPVTVFRSRDFFISALYWLDGTTAIHSHAFSGAYRVLHGSSIHATYDFAAEERITSNLIFGDLAFTGGEHLRLGDVRPIYLGDAGIHSLFHLDRPSVTIVVRTNSEAGSVKQYDFLRPGVAYSPFFNDTGMTRKFQAIGALCSFAPDDAARAAQDWLDADDFWAGFKILQYWFDQVDRGERFAQLLDRFAGRHGAPAHEFKSVFENRRREYSLMTRRQMVRDARHRLFFALLLNLPDRATIDAILRQVYPGQDPRAFLVEVVKELASPELRGASGINLPPEDLAAIEQALAAGTDASMDEALRTVSRRVRVNSTIDKLFD